LHAFLICPIYATCPTHLILDFITLITLYNLQLTMLYKQTTLRSFDSETIPLPTVAVVYTMTFVFCYPSSVKDSLYHGWQKRNVINFSCYTLRQHTWTLKE
jgi:hypothetical protein